MAESPSASDGPRKTSEYNHKHYTEETPSELLRFSFFIARLRSAEVIGMLNVGAVVANFHEGSRSEYLANYVFASFGTAISVPDQEDTGVRQARTLKRDEL